MLLDLDEKELVLLLELLTKHMVEIQTKELHELPFEVALSKKLNDARLKTLTGG